jgi:hypothetical protein
MKKLYIITLILFLFFAQSCKEKTRICPCFPEKYLTWLPYENQNQIKFTNLQDTIVFFIEDFYKSEEYEIDSKFDVSCHSEANFITQKQATTNYILNGISTVFENSDDATFQYYINNNNLTDEFTFRIIDNEINYATEIFENLVINQKDYNNVIYLNKDTLNNNVIISDLYIAENFGIVKFKERDGTEWLLINE